MQFSRSTHSNVNSYTSFSKFWNISRVWKWWIILNNFSRIICPPHAPIDAVIGGEAYITFPWGSTLWYRGSITKYHCQNYAGQIKFLKKFISWQTTRTNWVRSPLSHPHIQSTDWSVNFLFSNFSFKCLFLFRRLLN